MTLQRSSRATLLALAVMVGGVGAALAHALPGSSLLFQRQGDALHLTITFPLEDLVIAAPDLIVLQDASVGDPLSADMVNSLTDYLAGHLSLSTDRAILSQTAVGARLQSAYQDHLGDFSLVVSEWLFQGDELDLTPAKLRYDAIMHEVRNHRATVQWRSQDGEMTVLSVFGFQRSSDGVVLDPFLDAPD